MASHKEPVKALWIIIALLLVGGVLYVGYPPGQAEEPVRIVYKGSAGSVVFSHQAHASDDGFVQDCQICHHNIEDDDVYDCRECHGEEGDEDLPGITDALHAQCIHCHEDLGAGPMDCAGCHRSK